MKPEKGRDRKKTKRPSEEDRRAQAESQALVQRLISELREIVWREGLAGPDPFPGVQPHDPA